MEIVLIIVGLFIYFIPYFVGSAKKNSGAIFLLNLFLGWTFIGWIVALIWASTKDQVPVQIMTQPQPNVAYTCKHCKFVSKTNSDFCPACELDDAGHDKEYYKNKVKNTEK